VLRSASIAIRYNVERRGKDCAFLVYGYGAEPNQEGALSCDQNCPTSKNVAYFIFRKFLSYLLCMLKEINPIPEACECRI
jgi:hypothetical protein